MSLGSEELLSGTAIPRGSHVYHHTLVLLDMLNEERFIVAELNNIASGPIFFFWVSRGRQRVFFNIAHIRRVMYS